MAIVKQKLPFADRVRGFAKTAFDTRLVKTDIVRSGSSGWLKTVRQVSIPGGLPTSKQLGYRSLFSFCSWAWHTLSTEEFEKWDYWGWLYDMRTWEFFLYWQLYRWKSGYGPQREPKSYPSSSPIAISAHSFSGIDRAAVLSVTPESAVSIYGVCLFRSESIDMDPFHQHNFVLIPSKSSASLTFVDSPVPRGDHYYSAFVFNVDGQPGPMLDPELVSVL